MASMTLQNLIDNHIRPKLDDDEDIRWTDAVLVNMIIEVIDVVDGIVKDKNLQFGKQRATLTTVADQAYIDVSSQDPPIASIIDIYRATNKRKMVHEDEDGWETIYTTGELYHYLWLADQILLKGTPSAAESLYMWYWPEIDTSSYSVSTSTPWDGKLDFIIAQHVVVKCQNVDEMDIAMDDRFVTSLEYAIQRKFAGLYPRRIRGKGFNRESTDYSRVVT